MRAILLVLLLPAAAFAADDDFSVAFIAREPKIDYVWNSANPRVEGWPAAGSDVRWVANVRWLGTEPIDNVSFRWLLDGEIAATGTLDFAPDSVVRTELPWTWTFDRHEIVFEIDDARAVPETEERNNRVLIHTNALGVAFYVERTFWDTWRQRLPGAGIGATTFEDWMQRRIRQFNEMAQYSVYADAPQGVLDRWRIDAIHIVGDDALPLAPPYEEARDWGASIRSQATLYPNVRDHTVDMMWGFPSFATDFYQNDAWTLLTGNSLIHELAHARTMIDTYAWNITRGDDSVFPGGPGTKVGSWYYATSEHGLMHFDWGHIDRFTAVMMNAMAGHRARRGNYNEPWDLGWFLNDFPETNRVRFIRTDGSGIGNATIRVHRPIPDLQSASYAMRYPGTPSFTLTTDAQGWVTVPRNIISDEPITAFVDRTNGTAIIEISDGGYRRWAYLESLQFNLAYHLGKRDYAEYTVMADAPHCHDALGGGLSPRPEALVMSPDVTFRIAITRDHRYDFYYAVDGGDPMRVEVGSFIDSPASFTLSLPPGRINWWFVDTSTAPCPPARSSIYAFDHMPVARSRAVGR